MADVSKDEQRIPRAEDHEGKKRYARPYLRHLGSVRELTAGGTSKTHVDGLHMRTGSM